MASNRLLTQTCDAIPAIARERRDELLELVGIEPHDELMARAPETQRIELVRARTEPVRELCTVCWNGERGRFVLEETPLPPADLYLLNEMDVGMARSENAHTVRQLARRLDMSYVFAVEFLELTKGEPRERDAPGENELGFHGNAIVTRCPIRDPRVLRLDGGEQWLHHEQCRIGSRIALIANVETTSKSVRVVCTHLESEAAPELRARQMRQLMDYLARETPEPPTVIGGDLNSWSFDKRSAEAKAELAAEPSTPARLLRPMVWEPLFEALSDHGYAYEGANDLARGTYPIPGFSVEGRLDWIATKGLVARDPAVIPAPYSERMRRPVSDHHAIRVCLDIVG